MLPPPLCHPKPRPPPLGRTLAFPAKTAPNLARNWRQKRRAWDVHSGNGQGIDLIQQEARPGGGAATLARPFAKSHGRVRCSGKSPKGASAWKLGGSGLPTYKLASTSSHFATSAPGIRLPSASADMFAASRFASRLSAAEIRTTRSRGWRFFQNSHWRFFTHVGQWEKNSGKEDT